MYMKEVLLPGSPWIGHSCFSPSAASLVMLFSLLHLILSFGQSLLGNQTIVSQGSIFQLGFFKPGRSQNSYIAIWYKNIPEKTTVWVANRDRPVTNSLLAELKISEDGNMLLVVKSKIPVWSTNITSIASKSTIAQVFDTGNFVLRDFLNSSMVYWQSFDHPTDTWLPAQRLGWNKNTKEYMTLTPWRSPDDPSPGLYSLGVDTRGMNQMVQSWNGSEIYWTSGEWNGHFFIQVPEMTGRNLFIFTFVESERYMIYTVSDTSFLTRSVLDVSGRVLQWIWLNNTAVWSRVWSQPRMPCDIYSICGVFSVCDDDRVQLCECLQGFTPAFQNNWDSEYFSEGCVRKTPLQCGSQGEMDRFVMIPSTRLPKYSKAVAGCKSACLTNCSCIAYTYKVTIVACVLFGMDISTIFDNHHLVRVYRFIFISGLLLLSYWISTAVKK